MKLLLLMLSLVAINIQCMEFMLLNEIQRQNLENTYQLIAMQKINKYKTAFAPFSAITNIIDKVNNTENTSAKVASHYVYKGMTHYLHNQQSSENAALLSQDQQAINSNTLITREQAIDFLNEDLLYKLLNPYSIIVGKIMSNNYKLGNIMSLWADQDNQLPQEYRTVLDDDCCDQMAAELPNFLKAKNNCCYKCTIL